MSVVLSSSGLVKEWVKYSAYGVPYSITPGDFDADGFLTSNDSDEFDAAYNGGAGAWDARVDLNLDGSLTSADETIFTDEFNNGEAAGLGVLSRSMVANRIGYAGYQHARELAGAKWHVRHRVLDSETGRWTRRDPLGYVDGVNLFEYVGGRSLTHVDPSGGLMQSGGATEGTAGIFSCIIQYAVCLGGCQDTHQRKEARCSSNYTEDVRACGDGLGRINRRCVQEAQAERTRCVTQNNDALATCILNCTIAYGNCGRPQSASSNAK